MSSTASRSCWLRWRGATTVDPAAKALLVRESVSNWWAMQPASERIGFIGVFLIIPALLAVVLISGPADKPSQPSRDARTPPPRDLRACADVDVRKLPGGRTTCTMGSTVVALGDGS